MRRLDLNKMCSVCLDAITSRISPQAYLDRLHECLDLPLMLVDSSLNAIAFSFELPFFSELWDKAARREISSQEVLDNKSYFFRWQDQCSVDVIVADSTFDNKDPAVIGPVICNDKVVATCGIMVCDAETEDVMEAGRLYCKTLSVIMRYTPQTESAFEKIKTAEELLLGGSQTLAGTGYPPEYLYAVCRADSSGIARLQHIQTVLEREESSFFSCLEGDTTLCLLFYGMNDNNNQASLPTN